MVARGRAATSSSRGGIAARRKEHARADRDGDLDMGSAPRPRAGGISKKSRVSDPNSRGPKLVGKATAGLSTRAKNDLQRQLSSAARIAKSSQGSASVHRGSEDLVVTGWKNNKASDTGDGGVSSLIAFLEKRATLKSYTKSSVRITKTRVEDDALFITVPGEHVGVLIRLDGYAFAGKNIKIERASTRAAAEGPDGKKEVQDLLKRVLDRRYNADAKLLDLSNLAQDPDLASKGMFDKRSTTEKFFGALMKVFQQGFPSNAKFAQAVQSISLAHNMLPNVTPVTTLAQFLPGLLNLDLSHNAIPNLAAIEAWRNRFAKLDHLLINNNPIEQAEPDYAQTIIKWYPRLRNLNGSQVRSDEEAAKAALIGNLPFPFRTPNFQDEGQIAETFIRNFFTGFDTDRQKLLELYYDQQSDFSYAVNTSAPRDPNGATQTNQDWNEYIKTSRNLNKVTHLPARQARQYRGQQSILEAWNKLPRTRHPDLAADATKWLIECQLQPGVPDPTGQSPGGVDGFMITIHGEYDELDPSNGQTIKQRSFDRTLILGPGGPAVVRVVNDMMVVRAFGGTQAFNLVTETYDTSVDATIDNAVPDLPAGLTIQMAEQMVLELQKQTNMTIDYAKDCLGQVQWDMQRAVQTFAAVRESLPPTAFIQGG